LQIRDSVDGFPRAAYSGGMISEFQELSDKIDQLAEMVLVLRRENAQLRQSNVNLAVETMDYRRRLSEASERVAALLQHIPPLQGESGAETQPEKEDAQ